MTFSFGGGYCTARQISWIQSQKGEAKKAGVLPAVAKVPTLLKKLQASSNAAVVTKNGRAKAVDTKAKSKDEVNT